MITFDAGSLSSDAGVPAQLEVEGRLRVADRLAACIEAPPVCDQIAHTLSDINRFRPLMVATDYLLRRLRNAERIRDK